MSGCVCKQYSIGGRDTDDVIQMAECESTAVHSKQLTAKMLIDESFHYCKCDH